MSEDGSADSEHPFDSATIGDEIEVGYDGRIITAEITGIRKGDARIEFGGGDAK